MTLSPGIVLEGREMSTGNVIRVFHHEDVWEERCSQFSTGLILLAVRCDLAYFDISSTISTSTGPFHQDGKEMKFSDLGTYSHISKGVVGFIYGWMEMILRVLCL